jgi:hypothetical protein
METTRIEGVKMEPQTIVKALLEREVRKTYVFDELGKEKITLREICNNE